MSRGVKDLRKLICVSRLNCSEELNDVLDVINLQECISIKLQNKSFNYNKKKAVISDSREDDFETFLYEKSLLLINEVDLKKCLEVANSHLNWLNIWSNNSESLVYFMQWWLSDVSDTDRVVIIKSQRSNLYSEVDRLLKKAKLPERLIMRLLDSVLSEYSLQTLDKMSPQLFIDHLQALHSQDDCKKLLSNVDVTPTTAHIILTLRAFTLLSLVTAIVRANSRNSSYCIRISQEGILHLLTIVLRQDFVAVLSYWVQRQKIDPSSFYDTEGRSLVTLSVSHKSKLVLKYILENFDVSKVINTLSEAGNSALHLAVCQGSLDLVAALVNIGHAQIDVQNPYCDNCTPLQMALTYGYNDIVEFLQKR